MFDEFDLNHDGELDYEELNKAIGSGRKRNAKVAGPGTQKTAAVNGGQNLRASRCGLRQRAATQQQKTGDRLNRRRAPSRARQLRAR